MFLNMLANAWINFSDYAMVLSMPHHLRPLVGFWMCPVWIRCYICQDSQYAMIPKQISKLKFKIYKLKLWIVKFVLFCSFTSRLLVPFLSSLSFHSCWQLLFLLLWQIFWRTAISISNLQSAVSQQIFHNNSILSCLLDKFISITVYFLH